MIFALGASLKIVLSVFLVNRSTVEIRAPVCFLAFMAPADCAPYIAEALKLLFCSAVKHIFALNK